MNRIIGELERIFANWALKELAESDQIEDLPEAFEFTVEKKPAVGEDYHELKSGCLLKPGDHLKIKLLNGTDHSYEIALFHIDTDYFVQSLTGDENKRKEFRPSDVLIIPDKDDCPIDDHRLGTEYLLAMALPKMNYGLDWITQPPEVAQLRGGDELEELDRFSKLQELLDTLRHLQDISSRDENLPPPAIRLFTLCTEWPDPKPPSSWMGGRPDALPSAFLRDKAPEGIPDPWRIGPRACLADSSPGRTGDLLLAGGDAPRQVLIDLDVHVVKEGEDPAERICEFEAEAAFHFIEDRNIAFYDTDDDGEFDLVLEARRGNPIAHTRHVKARDAWRTEKNVNTLWLSTRHLGFLWETEEVRRAMSQFAVLAGGL